MVYQGKCILRYKTVKDTNTEKEWITVQTLEVLVPLVFITFTHMNDGWSPLLLRQKVVHYTTIDISPCKVPSDQVSKDSIL